MKEESTQGGRVSWKELNSEANETAGLTTGLMSCLLQNTQELDIKNDLQRLI